MKENLSFQILSSQHCIKIELEDNGGQCLSDLRMKGFNKPKIMKGNYKRKVGFKILLIKKHHEQKFNVFVT